MKEAADSTNFTREAAHPADTKTRKATLRDYLELTKPRLSSLSVITALVGYLAARPEGGFFGVFHVLLGTGLAAGGAAVLNQWLERATDARMARTRARPIPAGVLPPAHALIFGLMLSIAGAAHLLFWLNGLAGLLAAATILIYVCLYTPLKQQSRLSLEVGALAGALPPLIGWAAAEGHISALGWILFGILFFWQIPHFLAIGWIYRDDYANVNFPMLPVLDGTGEKAATYALVHCGLLVAVSVLPWVLGLASWLYLVAAILTGFYFLWTCIRFKWGPGRNHAARHMFHTSISYLPAMLAILVIDRWLFGG